MSFEVSSDKCDGDVYNNGRVVAALCDVEPEIMDLWCKIKSKECGQKIDWSFVGGRIVVKALGDLAKVDAAIYNHRTRVGVSPTLSGLGGAVSAYGYYPHGENHWSING